MARRNVYSDSPWEAKVALVSPEYVIEIEVDAMVSR